ncbi:GP46-like surface antigen, putative [Bodo saltans]|uniref:GP46-like surface antigen, putative n=1 Tax=Bodo saltans TaxID=75058 RepID=A0A0S4J2G0_BODSA|nr:GP46-like surface antigen, putative [Bodo saltans]|eukprot:CUG59449.1 GP46-like surface antigen, putative [Bodo saltans]
MVVAPVSSGIASQAEVDVMAEFFTAVRYANTTPVTQSSLCTSWPSMVVCTLDSVTALNFTNINLRGGTLPASLSRLANMTSLVIKSCSLTGTLPPSFSSWPRLSSFDVSRNDLTGSIPSEYSRLTSIQIFSCEFNSLNGTLPASLSAWGDIYTFTITGNSLSGTLPAEYAAWRHVTVLNVENNSMTGVLQAQYSALTAMFQFDASTNLKGCCLHNMVHGLS